MTSKSISVMILTMMFRNVDPRNEGLVTLNDSKSKIGEIDTARKLDPNMI
jgi:hypothetical protein